MEELREQKSLFELDMGSVQEEDGLEVIVAKSVFDTDPENHSDETKQESCTEQTEPEERKKFWRRQFQQEPTRAQRKFDWIFGVIMPVVCIFFDPLFFSGEAMWGAFKPFAYAVSFTGILAMMAWLIWGRRLKWMNAFIAGLFLAGAVTAFAIGVFMLPLSLLALVVVIGALGFTPFFTALVYLRSSVRAADAAELFFTRKTLIYTVILSVLVSTVIPYVTNVQINRWFGRSMSVRRVF